MEPNPDAGDASESGEGPSSSSSPAAAPPGGTTSEASGSGAGPSSTDAPPPAPPHQQQQPPSRYESQKRRDWNTFLQYLKNHKPPLTLSRCSGAHVIEFLKYLDQFGKTKVHASACPYFGHPNPPAPCACPLRQAWGSLDALIGRLRAAYEENGGRPESNPFGAKAVRIYLREVRESQAKARGIPYEKKKRKRPPPASASPPTTSAAAAASASQGTETSSSPTSTTSASASATVTIAVPPPPPSPPTVSTSAGASGSGRGTGGPEGSGAPPGGSSSAS